MEELTKIYVEPTSRCNLNCVTCIRHSWNEKAGDMEMSVYRLLLDGLADFPGARTVAFSGLGEPLLHEGLPDMIRWAHERGLRTEITSNALLLTSSLADRLVASGLDQFTVSIDGASIEAHAAIRSGASLDRIKAHVLDLYQKSTQRAVPPIRIGIEFVAMRRNLHELPRLGDVGKQVKASFILVSNVLPYTADLQNEILYCLRPGTYESEGTPYTPLWMMPQMDFNDATLPVLGQIARGQSNLSFLDIPLSSRSNYCPFVQNGCLAVAWHGGVSPCPPLMHSYVCYIRNRKKDMQRCAFGRLPDQSLREIWNVPDFVSFRARVRAFDFPPCSDCGGCLLAETNETDCLNNPFPVCGDCLWARGVLRCA